MRARQRTTGPCRSPRQEAALSVSEPRVRRSAPLRDAPLAADYPRAGSLAASFVTTPDRRLKADAGTACRIMRASDGYSVVWTRAGGSWTDGMFAGPAGEGYRRNRTGDPWPYPQGVGEAGAMHHSEDGSETDSCANSCDVTLGAISMSVPRQRCAPPSLQSAFVGVRGHHWPASMSGSERTLPAVRARPRPDSCQLGAGPAATM